MISVTIEHTTKLSHVHRNLSIVVMLYPQFYLRNTEQKQEEVWIPKNALIRMRRRGALL